MSRSFVRLMAGVALVAVPMVSVQAQTCTVPTIGGSCPVVFNATLNVPVLASLEVAGGGTLALLPLTWDWETFVAAPAITREVSFTTLEVRSNSPYAVTIAASAWNQPIGAGRVVEDLRYLVIPSGACPAEASITASVAAGPVVTGGTRGVTNRTLCFALEIPGDLASDKLLPGPYSLPLTLTITAP